MEQTIEQVKAHLESKGLKYEVTDIWQPGEIANTAIENYVYLIVVEGDWKTHIAVRNAMAELGYVQSYEYNLDSGDSDYYMARHKYILKEAAEIFAEKLNLELPNKIINFELTKKIIEMTNEEKANEIAYDNSMVRSFDELEHYSYDECFESALSMAEWKDEQFKKYLEDRLDSVKNCCVCSRGDDFYEGMIEMLDEIINELFPEQEQDNSNRDE